MTGLALDVPSYSNEWSHGLIHNSTRSNANHLPVDGIGAGTFI